MLPLDLEYDSGGREEGALLLLWRLIKLCLKEEVRVQARTAHLSLVTVETVLLCAADSHDRPFS
jgi:hypothetical protein